MTAIDPNETNAEPGECLDQIKADAKRYRFLASRLIAADFDWGDSHESVLIISWPDNSSIGVDLDTSIDEAIKTNPLTLHKSKGN